jgi:ubiquinone/menaquinone biosynthesis C-methylase UbiE
VVGDFGCGECLLREALPTNRVIGLDHVKWDENVVLCDMSVTPLEDTSLDVAVFSLSLMGANWTDYLKEAYRTLKPYGHLFIAEPKKKWQDRIEKLKEAVETAGFRIVGDAEQRYNFVYLTALKA